MYNYIVSYTYFVHSGAVAYYNAYFGSGSGPYHLDDVYCTGTESSLLSCNRRYSIGVHDCRPGNEAGVKCGKCMVLILCLTAKLLPRVKYPLQQHHKVGKCQVSFLMYA